MQGILVWREFIFYLDAFKGNTLSKEAIVAKTNWHIQKIEVSLNEE